VSGLSILDRQESSTVSSFVFFPEANWPGSEKAAIPSHTHIANRTQWATEAEGVWPWQLALAKVVSQQLLSGIYLVKGTQDLKQQGLRTVNS